MIRAPLYGSLDRFSQEPGAIVNVHLGQLDEVPNPVVAFGFLHVFRLPLKLVCSTDNLGDLPYGRLI